MMSRRTVIDIALESRRLDELGPRLFRLSGLVGLIGLAASAALGLTLGQGLSRLLHSYLVSFCYFLSLSLGALFFVILHHLTRAGWSVVVRRFAEAVAGTLPVMAILAIPILVGVRELYPWAAPGAAAHDHLLQSKRAWLNIPFFVVRVGVYLGLLNLVARYFIRRSFAQDSTGDIGPTIQMERFAGRGMVIFGLALNFAAFDLLMTLDPHWYSTIFGVYYFTGSVLGFLALLPLITLSVQRSGRLRNAITPEHFHDMGKLLFAFTFFWAYIAFSQYMLIWYANIPEETQWFLPRQSGGWAVISLLLLFGQFLLPFLALLPRFVKRRLALLAPIALWILLMHWFDLYWLVMPQLSPTRVPFHLMDLTCFVGVGGIFLAAAVGRLGTRPLVPEKDPRLAESLAFENA